MYNYYKIANNATTLDAFGYMMKFSMYRTFAAKYQTSVTKIIRKYRIEKDFGIHYKTKGGMKTMLFYNEGFKRQDIADSAEVDNLPKASYKTSRTSLITRLKAKRCEWCGAEGVEIGRAHV